MYTDDECFFVGLGHKGGQAAQAARKSNLFATNDYRPFQCCPTKLERTTKVPKMTAQRLAHKQDHDSDKSGFHFNAPKKDTKPTATKPVTPIAVGKKGAAPATGKKLPATAEPVVNEKKENKADTKKALAKGKDKGGAKQGQKGLLGVGKIVNWL